MDLNNLNESNTQTTSNDLANLTSQTSNDKEEGSENERSLISVIVKNIKGSLAQVANYCGENNMNIERLVLSHFSLDNSEQKIILYITGQRERINSMIEGMNKLDAVVRASNFQSNRYLERELILVKVKTNNPQMQRIMDLVNEYEGKTLLFKNNLVIFQFINDEEKNYELMVRLEHITSQIEILKSGIVATSLDSKFNQ